MISVGTPEARYYGANAKRNSESKKERPPENQGGHYGANAKRTKERTPA
jgi:hypothetical protein